MRTPYQQRKDLLEEFRVQRKFYNTNTICTPFPLIEEILDRLPKEVWTNRDLKWLDPACGRGAFLLAIKNRLLAGIEEKHVVENMLYGADIDAQNVNCARALLAQPFDVTVKDKYNTQHIECCDSLAKDWGKMKFDVVVGNPPYQKGDTGTNKTVFDEFYYLATSCAKRWIVFIAPTMWLLSKKTTLQRLRDHLFDKGLYAVFLKDPRVSFGVVLDSLGVTFQDVTQCSSTVTVHLLDGTTTTITKMDRVTVLSSDPSAKSVLTKLTSGSTIPAKRARQRSVNRNGGCFNGSVQVEQSSTYPYRTINKVSGAEIQYVYASKEIDDDINVDRVVFSYLSSNTNLGKIHIIPGNDKLQLTEACTYVAVPSLAAGESLRSYLVSRCFRYALQQIRPGTNNSGGIFQQISCPPLDRIWSDADLYKHFDLTQDEIQLIERIVK